MVEVVIVMATEVVVVVTVMAVEVVTSRLARVRASDAAGEEQRGEQWAQLDREDVRHREGVQLLFGELLVLAHDLVDEGEHHR